MATGAPILPRVERFLYEQIAADLRRHYEATGTRDLREYSYRVKHLDAFFTGRRVGRIGQVDVDAYIVARQAEGAVGATIRRELGTLRRMLRLGYENGKVYRPISRSPPRSRTPTAGACRAKC